MNSNINIAEVSEAVKKALTELYGERLEKVILYGSYARGDFHAESDVDFLVVLRDEKVHALSEVFAMGPNIYPIQLHFGIDISTHAISLKKYQTAAYSFHENVRREGVLI